MYQEIFKQGKIGNITLKNRLVMSPMGTSLAEMDGSPSEDMIAFYEARAIGGAALIIPEIARVNDLHGAGMMRQLSVSKDRHIEGLAKLAETVHKYGTKIFIQLHHPGRETVTALTGGPVVSASAIPCKYLQQETRALSTEEVKALEAKVKELEELVAAKDEEINQLKEQLKEPAALSAKQQIKNDEAKKDNEIKANPALKYFQKK